MGAFETAIECYEVLTNAEARLKREGPFLLECLHDAPGNRCVDLACGTGLHALFLAQHGARVDAFDLSQAMIAYARQHRAHESIKYRVADMRQLDGGPWDLALCLGNSFSLLLTENEMEDTLRRTRERLAPGGLLVAQFLNYESAQSQEPRHRVEHRATVEAELVAVKSLVPHGSRTLLALNYFIARGTGHLGSFSETTVLRNWTHLEFTALAQQAGFSTQEFFGAFDRSDFAESSSPDVLTILAN